MVTSCLKNGLTGGGFGIRGEAPDFWLAGDGAGKSTHIAFAAPDRRTVDEFYTAALGAGGRDNGAPGIREYYRADHYYAAFVLDPDGNNIEAVCRRAE